MAVALNASSDDFACVSVAVSSVPAGPTCSFNVASTVPYHASQMYAKNVTAFLINLVKDGKLNLNMNDEIVRDTLLTQGGEVVNARVREFHQLPALVTQ